MFQKRHGSLVVSMLVLAALVATAGTGLAFQPQYDRHDDSAIPLREFDLHSYTSPAVALAKEQAAAAFSSVNGGHWSVYSWNPQTNTPHYLIGSGVQVAASLMTDEAAIDAARNVIRANPAVFKADLENLRVEATPAGMGKRAVHFQQTYHGVDVYGGKAILTFTEAGRLFVVSSDCYQGINVDPNPSIPSAVAKDIAMRSVPFDPATDSVEDGAKLLVLPVPLSETSVEYRLVWQVRVRIADPVAVWVTSVDAHSGQIVWRYNDVSFVDFVGTTHGQLQRPSYCEGQSLNTMPYLRIQIAGLSPVYADLNGAWTVPYSGSDSKAVTCDLYSPYVDVNNLQSGAPQGTFTGTAVPGVPLDVYFTDSNSQKDEKDVYAAINDIHKFYLDIDPTFGYTNARITAYVRRPGTCNAYWDGTINFYATGGGCHNTGEIMGVAYHEFTHGITDYIIHSQGSEGIGEGNSDVLSNLMLNESIIGRGFYDGQCTSGIRNSENTLRYPEDVQGQEIHYAGQVIAGFHWDSMQDLQARYGVQQGTHMATMTWHFGRVLQHPTTQPSQVLATFIADDDDGNLDNGTPHYDSYAVGATNHGFTPPPILTGVFITHTPIQDHTAQGDVNIAAIITSTEGALVADSLRLNYQINGGAWVRPRLNPTGNPNEFASVIPGLHTADHVDYYLRARDVYGNVKNAPETGVYSFDIPNSIDPLEVPTGWAVNVEGGDNATSGLWVHGDPVGTTYNGHVIQPEDDHTPAPGVNCWVTGNANPDDPAGTQDVDGGKTTLYSALYNFAGASVAKIKYAKWYTDNLGINAGDDTWIVQVRNNGGTWQDVENTTVSPNTWTVVTCDLAALFGANLGDVQFKFIANDTGANSLLEAVIDDISIISSAFDPTAVPAENGAARFALYGAQPNPAVQGTSVKFQVPARMGVRLAVYDVSGRQVKVLADGQFDAGVHTVSWDGNDAQGHRAASGVYYTKMQANEYNATRTVVLTR